MGDGRVPAFRAERRVDQTRPRSFSYPVSAHQSGCLLARALAKSRSVVQQLARQFFGRIIECVSRRRSESRLVRQFDSAGYSEVECKIARWAIAQWRESFKFPL